MNRKLHLGNLSISIKDGLAQGSTLSPTLFSIYTAELHTITDNNLTIFQFADDLFLVSVGKGFEGARDRLLEALTLLTLECRKIGLSNLGRTICANNSSMNHIKDIISNIKRSCGFYRILNHRNKGIAPNRALQIYRAFIRPRIEYAVTTFSNLGKNTLGRIRSELTIIFDRASDHPFHSRWNKYLFY